PRDRARQQQLEGEIKRLIAIADQSIRDRAEQPRGREARLGLWLGALSLGVVVFCGALLGLTYHQQQRASERMQLEFAALQQRLIEQAADQRSVLEARIASIERDRANLGALEAELRARADEFDRLLGASGAAGASALAGQDGVVSALQERAATLERRLVQVEGDLAALAQRLPAPDGGVKALAERLETSRAALERVEGQVAAIQAQAPELALWLEGRRQALARDLESRGAALGKLDAEITALRSTLDDSRGRLTDASGALEQLGAARAAQLAELETWAAAARAELDRTQAALIADWRAMDEAVAERHAKALADLDQYAATLEVRVKELLEALDVIVARTSG